MMEKKINNIEFRILGPELIRKLSAIEIKTPETYDKDGYPMEEGLMDPHLGVINPGLRCKTCGQKMKDCPGHFGSFEMVRPVLHPLFGKKIEIMLLSTCFDCGKILLPQEKINALVEKGEDAQKKIKLATSKIKKCPHCNSPVVKVKLDKPTNLFVDKERIYPTEIRAWLEKIPNETLPLFGIDPKILRPEWLVLTVLPVPPITIRPSITLETGIKSEDDLTHKLVDIVRINMRLKDNIDAGAPQLIIEDLWDLLQYHVTTYIDNQVAGVPPAKHRSGRPLRTIVQRLKGKKGRFRYNLTGKRVNHAARSTVSPDPYLSINEVGVPAEIAQDLIVPERVTEWNIDRLKKLIKKSNQVSSIIRTDKRRKIITPETRDDISEELEPGFIVERQLMDKDIVLFNRQPSLHRLSMLAHYAKITPDKTLKLNPIVCKPYNADFDGDEMNLHVPQTDEGQTEAKELMLVEKQIMSPRHGGPIIILDEDGVSGSYVLTMDQTEFSKDEALQAFYEIGLTANEIPKPDKGKNYSGKIIFSQLLPKDLNLEFESKTAKVVKKINADSKTGYDADKYNVIIKNGVLVQGVIDATALGEGKGMLIETLARNYPHSVVERFYYRLNRVIGSLLTRKGMTVGLDEYLVSDEVKKTKKKAIQKEMEKSEEIVKNYESGKLELIPGKTLDESFELSMLRLSSSVKTMVEHQIMKEKMDAILGETPKLNTAIMIASGSRGNSTNLMNIGGFWGQATVREGRPKKGFQNRFISLKKKEDVGAIAGGFISTNFMEGMNPSEYFFHSIGGRQGEVDTGVSTKVSGYLYRRLANSLKDLSVKSDLSVRTGDDNIVQFTYGEDGVFPMNVSDGKSVNVKKVLDDMRKK